MEQSPHLLTYLLTQRSKVLTYLLTPRSKVLTYLLHGAKSLLTYLLTPWSKVLLKKLIDSHLGKKFSAFYGTRKFITTFTSARHLSLS